MAKAPIRWIGAFAVTAFTCPRQDSNLRTRLRRAVLYPLSYGGAPENSTASLWAGRPHGPGRRGRRNQLGTRWRKPWVAGRFPDLATSFLRGYGGQGVNGSGFAPRSASIWVITDTSPVCACHICWAKLATIGLVACCAAYTIIGPPPS